MSIPRTILGCVHSELHSGFSGNRKKTQKRQQLNIYTSQDHRILANGQRFCVCSFFLILFSLGHRNICCCCCWWCFCYRLFIRPVIKTNRNFSDRTFSFRILFTMNRVCSLYDFFQCSVFLLGWFRRYCRSFFFYFLHLPLHSVYVPHAMSKASEKKPSTALRHTHIIFLFSTIAKLMHSTLT